MKKIPTIFKRGEDHRVVNEVREGCEWVLAGEGVPTRKYDGTCCMIRDGVLFKRYEHRRGKPVPEGFEPADELDPNTGKWPGWVPVGDGPEDKWFRQACGGDPRSVDLPNGTYELIGPKVQGNPEGMEVHKLMPHALAVPYHDCPRDFDGLRVWLSEKDIEGIVFHHPDGRMAKIKKKDFGLPRKPKQERIP